MNDNLKKLNDLITETAKVVKNLNLDTAEIRQKTTAKNQERFDAMMKFILKHAQVAWRIPDITIMVPLRSKSPYGGNYFLRLDKFVQYVVVFAGKDCCLGHIPYEGSYSSVKRYSWCSNLRYEIDDILDAWDEADFELQFSEAVETALTALARKTNESYETAKKELEKATKEER